MFCYLAAAVPVLASWCEATGWKSREGERMAFLSLCCSVRSLVICRVMGDSSCSSACSGIRFRCRLEAAAAWRFFSVVMNKFS